jgi:ribonuclease VapC
MVVDTSALIAIAWSEPERAGFMDAIESDTVRLISAAGVLEATIVVMRRAGRDGAAEATRQLHLLIDALGLEIEPVTAEQVELAEHAYRTYGKGLSPAGLNFGDCFAYGLGKATGEPLLFKGDDFTRTDIRSVQ